MTYTVPLANRTRLRAITGTLPAITPLPVTPPIATDVSDCRIAAVIDNVTSTPDRPQDLGQVDPRRSTPESELAVPQSERGLLMESPDEMMFSCPDCGIDPWGFEEDGQVVHEEFYVSNELWDAVCPDDKVERWVQNGHEFGMGHFVMCIRCFEKRLGRKLTRADLRSGPRLNIEGNPPSKRFIDRWEPA